MKLYKKRSSSIYTKLVLSVAVLAAIIVAFIFVLNNASENIERENKIATENAINRALVTCYSVEGFYPNSTDYLEEHYGIILDRSKYVVYYDFFADNIMPQVSITEFPEEE